MKALILTIDGMSCGHCLSAVNRALASLPGVQLRGVQMGRAELSYEPLTTDASKIVAAVAASGYSVIGVQE